MLLFYVNYSVILILYKMLLDRRQG